MIGYDQVKVSNISFILLWHAGLSFSVISYNLNHLNRLIKGYDQVLKGCEYCIVVLGN